ncbi:PAS and ANTAR domain-containing protein [Promicromonospora sp. MS192]|uniref:PAS and ANTAR domain-containing protein n=1 Tax=Promicromonospora sp. MS192 TaxID=3412684 RepID=UPI003C302A3F
MNGSRPTEQALEAALAPGHHAPVGRYRLDVASGRWSWSDEVFVMHGFSPGEIVPTTELILSHKHPDDRDRVDHVLRAAAATGRPFSSVHRIVDAHGASRTLAVTGQARRDPTSGVVTELYGYFIDVTEASREDAQREATASIRAAAEHRASIEQAKGAIMVAFGITDDEAFDRLRTASNQLNVPVRELATWLVDWLSDPSWAEAPRAEDITDFLAAPVPPGTADVVVRPEPTSDAVG